MQRLTTGLIAVALLLLGAVSWQVQSLSAKVTLRQQQELEAMQTLHDSWRCNHVTKEVTTTRLDGESDADFRKRHNDICVAQQAQFPPDNT